MACARNGSKPARTSPKELATRPARRVPPPLRFGAALVYVLIHYKPAGRDPAGAGRGRVFARTKGRTRSIAYGDAYGQPPDRYRVQRQMIPNSALVPVAWQ